ncbi:MAG TPA: ATP-binding protein [Chitinophagaceae bacterium]|jgi:PAS domain S-box-containing protein|nr:ATP-binding protein [Chitinophagaceae bacterium]
MRKKTLVSDKKSGARSIDSSAKITKNKKAEDELLNNEELLKKTLDSSFAYIQVFKTVRDKHRKIIDFIWVLNNRKTIEFQGDRVGESLLRFNPGVVETGLFDRFVQVTETGVSHTLEFYYDHEGFDDWLHQTIVKLNDGFILTGEIITERKKIEQEVYQRTVELKESRDLLQSIAEAIPDMVSVQEYPSRKIIYFNREPYGISGLNADELAKKTLEERHKLVHPEDIGSMQEYSDSFKTLPNDNIATIEYRVLNRLNEWIWLRARGKVFERDEKGNVISIVVVVQDITAQKKGEEEITKQHNILKQAEELAKIGSWEYNIKTKEFLWSDGMYALFNMNRGKQVSPAIYLDHAVEKDRDVAEKLISGIERSFQPFEKTMDLKIDGEVKAIKIKATPLKNDKGEVEKMLGVNMDITASVESAQKIVDLNESLLTMNKELNSLNSELRSFNSITTNNYSEALRHVYINLETIITSDARHLSDSGRANIRRAQSAIQKMKLLTNDIHNYLELYDAGIKKELISPKMIVQDIIREAKEKIEETNVKIEIEELPPLSADPVLFSKLLTHLIDNSIKFRKPGEDPVVKIKHTMINELKNVPVSLTVRPYKIITVTDNCIGFEYTDKIFELFTQLQHDVKHKGSGMGLAICKKIMEMHSGHITAEAIPGSGASFHCFFPE